jgi:endonuclease I
MSTPNSTYSLNRLFLLVLTLVFSNSIFAQIPSGYYNNAQGKTGTDLKSALHGIIDGHTEYPYSSSNTDVWDILKVADRDPNNANNVIGIYSNFSMNAAAEYNSGSGWNREHVWAKSRGNFGTSKGAGTDIHHLRAADISTNSARNNRNFDEATTQYIDGSGGYQGATQSYTSSTDWIWEPRDEMKGDVARMIFYMVVRYEGTNGEPDLELTDTYLSSTDQSPFQGKASVLMDWHLADPVSSEEESRNDIVYSYQGNRNPFIDHPEYACEIFNTYCSGSGNNGGGGNGSDLFISEYIEGSSYNKAIEVANTTGTSIDLSDYSLKKQTNGAGSWGSEYTLTGNLNDGDVFVIAHSSAVSAITNEADVTTSSSIVTFNGNDPVGLFKNGVLIDVVGDFNGGSSNFAKDVTKVRVSSITAPNATYTSTEWENEASNTFSFLGSHNGGSGGSSPAANELFFSEYIEGSSYNKALEIANYTGSSVNLSDYSLQKQTNGSGSWGSSYSLSGSLADGDVFVIANTSANSSISAVADVTTGSGIVTFNGNDPVGLFKNGTLIDVIGNFSGGSTNFAKDQTLVRKPSVSGPNTAYTTSEWDTYASNTSTDLGVHTIGSSKKAASVIKHPSDFSIYPNPAEDVLYLEGMIGGDISIYSFSGALVWSVESFSKNQINLSQFKSGSYILFIQNNGKQEKISFSVK